MRRKSKPYSIDTLYALVTLSGAWWWLALMLFIQTTSNWALLAVLLGMIAWISTMVRLMWKQARTTRKRAPVSPPHSVALLRRAQRKKKHARAKHTPTVAAYRLQGVGNTHTTPFYLDAGLHVLRFRLADVLYNGWLIDLANGAHTNVLEQQSGIGMSNLDVPQSGNYALFVAPQHGVSFNYSWQIEIEPV